MKNKQGFLPNRLNKYSIRKFTVGTASLLIGATLVMGIGNEAQADELDSITSDSASTKDKGEALDVSDIKSVEDSNADETNNEAKTNENNDVSTQEKTESSNYSSDSNVTTSTEEQSSEEQVNSDESKTEEVTTEPKESDDTNKEDLMSPSDKSEENNVSETEEVKDSNTAEDNTDESTKNETPSTEDKETTNSEEVLNENTDSEKTTAEDNSQKDNTQEDTATQKSDEPKDEETTSESLQPSSEEDNTKETEKAATDDNDKTEEAESQLETELATSKDKQSTVKSFLSDQLPEKEATAIMDNANIDYDNATAEEINTEILKASLIELVNDQESATTLATPTRTMFRAMATPTALAAAVDQSEEVEKSLGYLDNYTFASLIFDPGSLDNPTTLNSNVIPFDIHSYMSGANSGDRYKIDLKLDPIIAQHVTKITVNPSGRSQPVEFVRLTDENGKLTNTWEVNFIRANDGLFGGAEILSQYTATNGKIELDDTVANILNSAGSLENNKLNYQMFVRDSTGNRIVRTSESSGYFLTGADSDLVDLQNSVLSENSNTFKASSGSAAYDDAPGEYGGFIIDQQIMKNGIFSYSKTKSNQWSYNYQIDK
ncbi:YSIRK-type signal peptide-containing protein [Staphylococcus pseudoxylosus]|uniref:YSIRK-type signal peptide-containing protein n=1 Tax=Staphylococcus pseudoxylosus TaxID=2282419 RepID=UPI002DBE3050|nr:YSIRK-type signal peptide-containing protein [Staphylococcus pseudoxylosus]MEB5782576.1 YSIRK-type signal peptide-containing protein [Staphylococcus pseudoxylosus]